MTSLNRQVIFVALLLVCSWATAQRQYGGIFPAQRLENIRKNAATDEAVAKEKADAVKNAAPWLEKSDDELWSMVPGQELPRCIDVTWDYDFPERPRLGCLGCGDDIYKYGAYPYEPDFEAKPWKLTCPNCGIVFPTNDFGKYYQSGINEQGVFDHDKADKSLLYNTEHPDPSDPLHKYGVDDGFGFVTKQDDGTGKMVDREFKYIGYYTWKYWRYVQSGLYSLASAYVYTGDQKYAHKAAILLDRIADVYPSMDWKPYGDMGWYHSDGSSRKGKIEGRIWETQHQTNMSLAYDKIISGTVDAPELYAFLAEKAKEYKLPGEKGTRADLIRNIDSGLLAECARSMMDKQVYGNEGMHQLAMVTCALALNTQPTTAEWLDWVFDEKGGHLPKMLMQLFDRDGMADEAAPGYCYLWPSKIVGIMELLEPYPDYTKHVITRDYPHFLNSLRAPWRVEILNTFTPNIGDTGMTGATKSYARPVLMAPGFQFYGDERAARYAWEANGSTADGLLLDAGSTTPDLLTRQLEQAALNYEVGPRIGENMAGYGYAKFEFGGGESGTRRPGGKALWMYYGRNTGHGHLDRLNYGLYAHGINIMPDLGYPEFANRTWKKRAAWNNNTLSHNTVSVDKKPQTGNWTGFPRFYTVHPGFGVVEVDSPNVYPGISQYMRTLAFIQAPDSEDAYVADIFRVRGGNDHLLSIHGPPGEVTASGLDNLVAQTTGTYAGENVAFGDPSTKHPFGYSYLKNVERQATPPASFTLDWKAEAGYRGVKDDDNIHLRVHVPGGSPLSDLALADGVPPQNKEGNPKQIRYALLHRSAESADAADPFASQFLSVMEPWKDKAFIKQVSQLEFAGSGAAEAAGMRIEFVDGTIDYIISNPERKAVTVADGPSTDGAYAWLRVRDGKVTTATLTQGKSLKLGDFTLNGKGNVAGKVVSFEKDPKKETIAVVEITEGDASDVVGAQIHIDNDKVRNGCYDIVRAEKDPSGPNTWKITCGPGSFVRGFVDEDDYSKGYVYNIAEGQSFSIPLTTVHGAN